MISNPLIIILWQSKVWPHIKTQFTVSKRTLHIYLPRYFILADFLSCLSYKQHDLLIGRRDLRVFLVKWRTNSNLLFLNLELFFILHAFTLYSAWWNFFTSLAYQPRKYWILNDLRVLRSTKWIQNLIVLQFYRALYFCLPWCHLDLILTRFLRSNHSIVLTQI